MKKLFSTRTSDTAFALAMLVLRVGAGFLMMANHGYDKLSHFAQKAPKFSYDVFGLGPNISFAMLVFAEFFCASFIIIGLFTRLASIPLIIAMAVAFIGAHKMNYSGGAGGGETSLLFLVCFITILIAGPGKFSLDRFAGK